MKERVQHGKNPGPAPYLTSSEEKELSEYVLSLAEIGYSKTRKEVKCIAEAVAKEKGTLKADRISDGWWRRFSERNSQYLYDLEMLPRMLGWRL